MTTIIGEALVDVVWTSDGLTAVPGGSAANVAIGLHRLGGTTRLVTTWGADVPGERIRRHLEEAGVSVTDEISESGRSCVALAYVGDGGEAAYDFLMRWDPESITLPSESRLLHTGSLALVVEPGAHRTQEACRQMRSQPGGRVALDLNVRPAAVPDPAEYRQRIERFVRDADLVKASDADLSWLYPDASDEEAAGRMLELGADLVVITRGPSGAVGITRNSRVSVAAPQVPVVDTIGAGDAFQAALLDALGRGSSGDPLERVLVDQAEFSRVLRRAAAAGGIACTRAGAVPPAASEIDDLVR